MAGDHGGTRRRGGLEARAGDEEPLQALYQGSMVGDCEDFSGILLCCCGCGRRAATLGIGDEPVRRDLPMRARSPGRPGGLCVAKS